MLIKFCTQSTIILFLLLLKELKYLKSLKSFFMAFLRDNNIFFSYFMYFILYALSFRNFFINFIKLFIVFFFSKIQKLFNCYRLWNPMLLCKLFNSLLNILLYWALNYFCFLDPVIFSQIIDFILIIKIGSSTKYLQLDPPILHSSCWNILFLDFYTQKDCL